MDTTSLNGLQSLLEGVGVESPIPSFSSADIMNSPIDIYVSYLANILVQLTGCKPQVAYDSILWPDDFCDLVVVLPRLRLKDVDPNDLAVELSKNFPSTPLFDQPFHDGINLRLIFSSNTLARIILPYSIDRGPSYGKDLFSGPREPDVTKVAEVAEVAGVVGVAEVPDVAEVTEVPDVPDIAKVTEATKVPDVAEVAEIAEAPDVPDVAEVTEVTEVTEVAEVTEASGAAEVPDVPDIAKVIEATEATEVPDVAEVTEATEAAGAPDVPGAAEVPDVPDIAKITEATEATEVPNVPEATEAAGAAGAAEVPDVAEVTEATEATKVPNVLEVTEAAGAAEVPDVPDIANVTEATEAAGAAEVPDVPDVAEATKVPNVPEVTEAAGVTDVLETTDVTDNRRNKVVVEFSSPNIGKQFDGNHLRSTIIGTYIASLYESMGWDVVRMNFLGDWGKHIGLLAAGWSRFGSEELFEKEPLRHLVDVYNKTEEIFKPEQEAVKKLKAEGHDTSEIETRGIWGEKDEFFKKMEDGDPDVLTLWERFREVCIKSYADLYARLNISFDDYSGESEVRQDTVAEVESILKEKEVYEDIEGAWVIDFKKHGLRGSGIAIARYRNGTTSYLLRDIAAVLERSRKYSFNKMIYVVSAKQDAHFQQLRKSLDLMGYSDLANTLQHVSFGRVQGVSEESGSGILLGDMLEQCQTIIHELLEVDIGGTKEFQGGDSKVLETLSATALMVQDLSTRRLSSFTFNIDKIAVTDGHTGLNLQLWFAKLSSKLKGTSVARDELESADYTIFKKEEYSNVLRVLAQFPHVVKSSFKPLESSAILAYLFRLTDLLPYVWKEEEDEGGASHQNPAELAFFKSVRQVLENGMTMIGLKPIEINY